MKQTNINKTNKTKHKTSKHLTYTSHETIRIPSQFVEAAFALAIFAYFDAAFSGDWSRIGVITVEQEAALKAFAPVVVGGHGLEAALAYGIASRRGWAAKDAAIIAVKTFLAGTVCLVEAALAEDPAAAADA